MVISVRAVCAVTLSLVAALALAFVVSADSSSAASKKQFTIGYVPPTVAPFEVALRKGLQLQAKKYGMKVSIAGGQFDPKVQIAAVKTLLTRGIDALVIVPLDEKSIKPALDEVRKKKIPIVVYDAGKTTHDVNFKANDTPTAIALAKYAAQKIGKPCNVAIIEGVSQVPILNRRNQGLAKGAAEAGCKVLDKQTNTDDSAQKATDIVRTWRTRFGKDLGGVLSINDVNATAVVSQVSGDFKPVITGMNGDTNVIEAIKKGRIAATAALLSPELGNGMVFAARQLLNGKKVPKTVNAPYKVITAANVGSYKSYAQRLKAPMTVSFPKNVLTTKLGG